MYPGSPAGADWHRWDLHVHTPSSYVQHYGDATHKATWPKYIDALAALPPSIRALGINDYYSIDGYRQVLQAHADGKLPNIALVLPVVELRLDIFVGTTKLNKINLHVVFSNDITTDEIERWFLDHLIVKRQLADSERTFCLGNATGLIELGQTTIDAAPPDTQTGDHPLKVGFANAAISFNKILEVLSHSVFRDRHLLALGLGEWQQMRWDGAGTVLKRDAIGRVDFVLTAAPTVAKYQEHHAKLIAEKVNPRLFDASDAHYFADSPEHNRLGQSNCWIKADLTFQGLRRAIQRFDDRVFVGSTPPKLDRIRQHNTKYIRRIEIHRTPKATTPEQWFDCHLDLSPDLVAIIGNQGSGKSALTDVIALSGDTDVDDFSFLTPEKFRDPKQRRASQFIAALTWCSGETVERQLDHRRDPDQQPRVRYVPQGFFDKITNETIADERSGFYREIQKVIFSHVPPHSRLDCTNLDDLLNALTAASQTEITRLRHRLSDVNGMIASLEDDASPRRVRALERLIIDKQAEIAALEARPPLAVPLARGETTETDAIDALRVLEAELEAQRSQVEVNLARIVEQRHAIDTARQQLTSAVNDLRDTIHDTRRALEAAGVGVDLGSCVTVTLKTEPLDAARTAIDEQQGAADTLAGDLTLRLAETRQAQADRVQRLEQESAAYEAYRTAQVEWQQRLSALRGDTGMPAADSQLGLQVQLRDLQEGIPVRIAELRDERNTLCRAIHEALSSLARQHSDVTRPVQEHIAADDLTRDHYRLAFNVALRPANLAPLLFGLIKQTGGPFHGVDAGEQRLREMVSEAEIESADGAIAFAHALLMMLADNHAVDPAILKQNHSVAELYDLIFGLTYLRPSYVLALNDQPLSRLSPGERGILLLVFYLCVDRGDEPLIIDQPEGNLNNQSIVENLVPVFKKAKARRQIIIVTHNPNIAVVCDAEQIIHCTMDIAAGFRLSYESGALENPKFNRLTLDLLEGTAPAFQSRRETYSPASGDRL